AAGSKTLLVLSPARHAGSGATAMASIEDRLLALRDALSQRDRHRLRIDLLSIGGAAPGPADLACPLNAALIAAFRVLAHEFPEHRFAGLDLPDGPLPATIERIDHWLRIDPAGRFVADRQ